MKNIQLLLAGLLISSLAIAMEKQEIPVLTFAEFEPMLHKDNDTLYVINFWATWCVPCRKELPEFEKFHLKHRHEAMKVILVSLDFVSRMESVMIPFLNEHEISANVVLLNDPNSNAWIDKVDPSWSGSLPATLIYLGNRRVFFEKELDLDQLEKITQNIM